MSLGYVRRVLRWGSSCVQKVTFNLPVPAVLVFVARGQTRHLMRCLRCGIRLNLNGRSIGNLRRNIHRVEKGLSHRPLRPFFALDYIEETVRLYTYYMQNDGDAATLLWARDVLNHYFESVSLTEFISSQRKQFEQYQITGTTKLDEDSLTLPSRAGKRAECPVDFDLFCQLAVRRRSVRCFTDHPVEEEVLRKALSVARLSPSACNRQSYCFNFFTQPDLIKQLSALPGGMRDFDGLAPAVCVVTVDYSYYFHERDLFVPALDVGLVAMSFQYSLETLGLSSVCINWPMIPSLDRKIRRIMSLKKTEMPMMFLAIGYPSVHGMIPASCKKNVQELYRYNPRVES